MRDISIDALKGFTMILVVVGHIIQTSFLDYNSNFLFRYIYSFHMPLFIFLSGYVVYKDDFVNKRFLTRKAIQLILPYFTWMIISSIIFCIFKNGNFIDTLYGKIIFPDNGLWFLWILFFMHCGYFLFRRNIVTLIFLFGVLFIFSFITSKVPNYFLYKTIPIYFIYYIFGVLLKKYLQIFLNSINIRIIGLLVLCLSLFLVFPGNRVYEILELLPSYIKEVDKIFISIIGIVSWFLLFKSFTKFSKIILYIGKTSLAIYILQSFCLMLVSKYIKYISNTEYYYFILPIIIFFIIAFCIIIFKILSMNKHLSFLLFGKTNTD
jgi:fucose 4-O-acetylase-like acetyltransferase